MTVSNIFAVDDATLLYNIYLKLCAWVGTYESLCMRIYIEAIKNPGFNTFSEILQLWS